MPSHEVDAIATRVLDTHPHLNLVHRLILLRREDHFVKQDLVRLIQRDPQLGPRVRAGYRAPVRDHTASAPPLIRDALDQLGYRRLHSVSMMISFVYAFDAHLLPASYAPYWRRLFATGWTASALAAGQPGGVGDRATAAALFGELGWFILERFAPDEFARVEDLAERYTPDCTPFADAVRCALGYHPEDIVRACVEMWGLPEWLACSLTPGCDDGLRALVEESRAVAAALGWRTSWHAAEAEVRSPTSEALTRLDTYAHPESGLAWLNARLAAQFASAHLSY